MKKQTKDKKSIKESNVVYHIRKEEIQEMCNTNIITSVIYFVTCLRFLFINGQKFLPLSVSGLRLWKNLMHDKSSLLSVRFSSSQLQTSLSLERDVKGKIKKQDAEHRMYGNQRP